MRPLLACVITLPVVSVSLARSTRGVASPRARRGEQSAARELVGLWQAKRRVGPDVRGTLLIKQTGGGWISSSSKS